MIWFPLGIFALLIILGLTFIPASKRDSGFIFSCVIALLASFLVSFLYSFIKNTFPLTDDFNRILVHYMVHDHLFFYYPGVFIVLVCMLCIRKDFSLRSAQAASLVLFSFYMFLTMLASYFYSSHGGWADPYFLFFLTGSRVLQCVVFAFAAPLLFIKPFHVWKILPALFILLVLPFATVPVSYLYYTSRISQAVQILAILYGAALLIILPLLIFFRRDKA